MKHLFLALFLVIFVSSSQSSVAASPKTDFKAEIHRLNRALSQQDQALKRCQAELNNQKRASKIHRK